MPWSFTYDVIVCVTEPRTTIRGYFRRTWKVAPSVTEPSSFVAVASAT